MPDPGHRDLAAVLPDAEPVLISPPLIPLWPGHGLHPFSMLGRWTYGRDEQWSKSDLRYLAAIAGVRPIADPQPSRRKLLFMPRKRPSSWPQRPARWGWTRPSALGQRAISIYNQKVSVLPHFERATRTPSERCALAPAGLPPGRQPQNCATAEPAQEPLLRAAW